MCKYVCMCVYIYKCMYVRMCVYIYTHIKRYLKSFLLSTLSKNYVSGQLRLVDQWWKSCILNCLLARSNEQRSSKKTILIDPAEERFQFILSPELNKKLL